MGKESGNLVQLQDGRIGRTYHKEKLVNGKIRVYVIAENYQDYADGKLISKDHPKFLCDISSLKTIGMAD